MLMEVSLFHFNISGHFILLVFIFFKYSYFIYSVFNDIFYVNNISNIFDNNLYITGLLNRDDKFLHYNFKVTGESITWFQQKIKFIVWKTFITSENNSDNNFYYF